MTQKVLEATCKIKYNGEVAYPGDTLKIEALNKDGKGKERIKRLYEIGAIRITEAIVAKSKSTKPEDLDTLADQVTKDTQQEQSDTSSDQKPKEDVERETLPPPAPKSIKKTTSSTPPERPKLVTTNTEVSDAKSNNR